MGSHRKPRTGLMERPVLGVSAAAALVTATLLTQTASADDGDIEEQRQRAESAKERAEEVRDRVDRLYQEAGTATQDYNKAEEEVEEQQQRVDTLLDEAAEAAEQVNESRRTLGSYAAAQYRHGAGGLSDTATLLLSTDPQSYFDQAHLLDRLGDREQEALNDFTANQQEAERASEEAGEALTELEEQEDELQEQKDTVQDKLAEARSLLDELTDEEEAAYEELERLEEEEAEREAREARQREQEQAEDDASGGSDASDSSLGAQAVAYAEDQLGKPYVWGATGPDSYDCSGLTQAAWRAAGVDIPRVTYDQVDYGTRISRGELQLGDLVFYYDDYSHVGIYAGNGQIIHAPKPGDVVKYESIDAMPVSAYVRVA